MKTVLLYFIITQVFPKDTVDNSYKYIARSNEDREFVLFMNSHKCLGDTVYVKQRKKK